LRFIPSVDKSVSLARKPSAMKALAMGKILGHFLAFKLYSTDIFAAVSSTDSLSRSLDLTFLLDAKNSSSLSHSAAKVGFICTIISIGAFTQPGVTMRMDAVHIPPVRGKLPIVFIPHAGMWLCSIIKQVLSALQQQLLYFHYVAIQLAVIL